MPEFKILGIERGHVRIAVPSYPHLLCNLLSLSHTLYEEIKISVILLLNIIVCGILCVLCHCLSSRFRLKIWSKF